MIIAVNKMDISGVDYSEARYKEVVEDVKKHAAQAGWEVDKIRFLPIAALPGENITKKSENTTWYNGPTLLEVINTFTVPAKPVDKDLRLPIQDVFTITGHGTVPVGRVETGIMKPGDNVVVQPSGAAGEVKKIEMHHQELKEAKPGDNVGFNVKGV